MYQIVMHSGGGTTRGFMDGFRTYEEAYQVCESYNWVFSEEVGGFEWDLEIVESDEEDCDVPEPNDYDYLDYDPDQDCGIYDDACDEY